MTKIRSECLPTAMYENGKWVLNDPYEPSNRKECTVYGEMSDGTLVWADRSGKHFTRQKFFGKYYFCEM